MAKSTDMNRVLTKLALEGSVQIRSDYRARAVNPDGNPITKAQKVEVIVRPTNGFSVEIEKPAKQDDNATGASTDPDAGTVVSGTATNAA
jgi:hypothetical protein